ncbi:hypothetical protein AB0D08_25940 [Kitasatospora sp. NPDC048540]|uniref:hypothetical protein n=1 Tax=unclassified Kitasatospora TaxID=2633591 RepID=UPI000AF3E61C|nr:hypothetical protein [Kitasatospora sp. MBT63]
MADRAALLAGSAAAAADTGTSVPLRSGIGWMVGAFVVTFLVTRMVTRMIRAGKGPFRDVSVGGLHIHHQVYGIFLMLIAGAAEFAYQPATPWRYVLAALFGAGAALTLDEFALWFHLDDVYWSSEGRKSVDAVLIAASIGLLLMLGANPFDIGSEDSAPAVAVVLLLNLGFSLCALFKGKIATGLIGVLIPLVAAVAAIRIAKPDSPWARWRYPDGSAKQAKARRRFPPDRRTVWDRLVDLLGGAPSS